MGEWPRAGQGVPYLAGDVLHAVWVVGLLASPAELPKIDLGGGRGDGDGGEGRGSAGKEGAGMIHAEGG